MTVQVVFFCSGKLIMVFLFNESIYTILLHTYKHMYRINLLLIKKQCIFNCLTFFPFYLQVSPHEYFHITMPLKLVSCIFRY